MINQYQNLGTSSGIELICDVPCRTLGGSDWKMILSSVHETIIFIDEENAFIHTKEFAGQVKESDKHRLSLHSPLHGGDILVLLEQHARKGYLLADAPGIHSAETCIPNPAMTSTSSVRVWAAPSALSRRSVSRMPPKARLTQSRIRIPMVFSLPASITAPLPPSPPS